MQSAGLNSLNHDIMVSYSFSLTPIFPKSGPTVVYQCKAVSMSLSTAS